MKLVNKERAPRTLLTIHGTIRFSRTCLAPADHQSSDTLQKEYHQKNVYPLDEALGIARLPFKITWKAMSKIAKTATKTTSFSEAAKELSKEFGENISTSTVERVTEFVGGLMLQKQYDMAKEAEQILGKRRIDSRRIRKQANDVLYIETDGAMVHVRDKEHVGMTNEEIEAESNPIKQEYTSGWTESKHAICFHAKDIKYYFEKPDGTRYSGRYDEYLALLKENSNIKVISHKIENRDCIGLIGKSDHFQYHIQALAERNDWSYTSTVVILSDGAAWIKAAKEKLFKRRHVIQILDLFHAKENAWKFANGIKDTDTSRKQYADHLCELIENGKVSQLLKELKPYENEKMKTGVPNLYTYISNNKNNMDYPRYKKLGLFVGSGAMESANIYMMQNRMKLPGMRWNVISGRKMLCLKSHKESQTWYKVDEALHEYALRK